MAYLAKIEAQDSRPVELAARASNDAAEAEFSALEWSVIRFARLDKMWTVRAAGRVRRFWNWVLARSNPELADPRLEALRRMAVLTWHFGFTVHGDDVADFLSAGFTPDQYELMAGTINSVLAGTPRIAA
jgi:hypothetical protein